jgi:hypothetical protein
MKGFLIIATPCQTSSAETTGGPESGEFPSPSAPRSVPPKLSTPATITLAIIDWANEPRIYFD